MNMVSSNNNEAAAPIKQLPINEKQLKQLKVAQVLGEGFQSSVFLANTEENPSLTAPEDVKRVAVKLFNKATTCLSIGKGCVIGASDEY